MTNNAAQWPRAAARWARVVTWFHRVTDLQLKDMILDLSSAAKMEGFIRLGVCVLVGGAVFKYAVLLTAARL
jgi:hypothetical protein